MPGPIGGRYRLVSQIARGGMGAVWEGWDEVLQRPVAIKMLHPQPGLSAEDAARANSRALREARITARLHHPNAVPVYDVVDEDGQPCLIMQYLPSTSLQELLRQKGTLPVADVARIGADIAAALAAAHEAGIVHRDVKPGNVLIAEDGTAKLTDFGIAHAFGDVTLTSTGMLTGTPAYLAPEVARGAPSSFPSDVFSLGATLYTALEGVPPFGSDDNPIAVLHRVASGQMTPPQRSGPLTPVLLHTMATDPRSRPPARDVARDMAAILAGGAAADATTVLQPRPTTPSPTAALPLAAAGFEGTAAPYRPTRGVGGPPRTTPPGVRPPRPSGPPGPPEDERTFPWVAIFAVALVLLLGLVIGVVLLQNGGGGSSGGSSTGSKTRSSAAAPTTHPSTRSATSRSSSAATHSSSSSSSSASRTSSSSSSAPTSSSSSSSSSSSAPPSGGSSSASLSRAITDYYALLPRNTAAAWTRLTPSYQNGRAGGRSSYDSFWGSVKRVTTSNVSGNPPHAAEATVTYYYKDGRVVDEDTEFQLVRQHGILKINSSAVLSSNPR